MRGYGGASHSCAEISRLSVPYYLSYETFFRYIHSGAMSIAIKALPTFRVYRDGKEEHVGELVGTKIDHLRAIVEKELGAVVPA